MNRAPQLRRTPLCVLIEVNSPTTQSYKRDSCVVQFNLIVDLSIVSHIDIMLISFWREKKQEQNLDKFLVQRENRPRFALSQVILCWSRYTVVELNRFAVASGCVGPVIFTHLFVFQLPFWLILII